MRILVAASGGEGHLGPLLPFVDAATTAGDDVVVVAPPEQETTLRAAGCAYELSDGVPSDAVTAIRAAMAAGSREDRVRLAEVELFGRLCTAAALPTVERVAAQLRPHLILREPCDYASAIAALRRGVPAAQVAISPGSADWGGLHLAGPVIEARLQGVTAAVERAPHLSRFLRRTQDFPDTRPYGFRVVPRAPEPQDPPLVWITFGTVNRAFAALEGTWRAVLDAVEGLPVQAIASVGRGGAPMDAPEQVRTVEWIELPEILARADVVVCHGGSGTTMASLAAGVPLVVIPLIADQPANAALVEEAHAGIAVRPEEGGALRGLTAADVDRVRTAISTVLLDGSYAQGARRAAAELTGRPGPEAVLARLRSEVEA